MEKILIIKKNKMHILIVSQYFWPEEFRINDLASELVLRGHQVTVLTGKPNYPKGFLFPAFKTNPLDFEEYNGVNIVRVPLFPRKTGAIALVLNYLSFVISACTIGVWKVRKIPFDVIFSPQLSPITAMLPAIFLRALRQRKYAMWVLDLWPETLQALGVIKSPLLLRWIAKLTRFIYHRTDVLYVQSKGFIENVRKHITLPLEIQYLPNWSEAMPDMQDVIPAPQVPEPAKETFNVMFAGAIGESQDFPAILKAVELLKDVANLRWLIVGDGRVSDWVSVEIKRRKLSNVVMLGRHPVNTMPSFYKHADAMLVALKPDPIFAMTIPGKIQSYLAAGKPIVAMLDGEGAKVVMDAGAGISVSSGDSSALAEAVRWMMAKDPAELKAMGNAARSYSDAVFNRTALIDRIEYDLIALTQGSQT